MSYINMNHVHQTYGICFYVYFFLPLSVALYELYLYTRCLYVLLEH